MADGNDAEGGDKAKQQQDPDSLKSKAGQRRRPPEGMNEPPPVKRVAHPEPSPDFSFFM